MKYYIAYEAKETYPATQKVYWVQNLIGPFDEDVAKATANGLKAAGRKNVKNIKVLVEV